MIKSLTNKQKFYLHLAGVFLLVWLSFKFGFSRSFELKEQIVTMEQQLQTVQDAPLRLTRINEQLRRSEQLLSNVSGDETSPVIIGKIGSFCKRNGLILKEIPDKVDFQNDEFTISTYKVVVQGTFKKMVKLLDELEQNNEAGKLRAVSFQSEFDLREGRKKLFGTYYLQTIGKPAKPK